MTSSMAPTFKYHPGMEEFSIGIWEDTTAIIWGDLEAVGRSITFILTTMGSGSPRGHE